MLHVKFLDDYSVSEKRNGEGGSALSLIIAIKLITFH